MAASISRCRRDGYLREVGVSLCHGGLLNRLSRENITCQLPVKNGTDSTRKTKSWPNAPSAARRRHPTLLGQRVSWGVSRPNRRGRPSQQAHGLPLLRQQGRHL